MNNNKLAVLIAFVGMCGKKREYKAEAGHCCVQRTISDCYGTLFACMYLLRTVWYN